MRLSFRLLIVMAGLVALSFIMAGVARAEEPTAVNSIIEDKVYQTYNEYNYPAGNRMFYLPRWHEVKFDIHNGKFFQIKYFSHHTRDIPEFSEESAFDCKVYFYTPTGDLFAIRRLKTLDKNRFISIPHNDRSPNYERLIIRIENNTDYNKDILFKVIDPVEPVRGTPIKHANFHVIMH